MGNRAPHAHPLNPIPKPHPKLAVRVIANETLILTPQDSVLHTLNPMATRIWQMMPGYSTLEELTAAIVEEFDIDEATAQNDLQELVTSLLEKQILLPPGTLKAPGWSPSSGV
jgi:hypothetical protein